MKILRIFLIFFTTVFTHQALAETESACKRNSDGEIIVANDNGQNIVTDIEENTGDSCKEAPDFYKLKFYRFGLCKSNPIANSTNDFSSCSYFVFVSLSEIWYNILKMAVFIPHPASFDPLTSIVSQHRFS